MNCPPASFSRPSLLKHPQKGPGRPPSLPFPVLCSSLLPVFTSVSQPFSFSQMRPQNGPEWDTDATRSLKRLSDSGDREFRLTKRARERASRRDLSNRVRSQPVNFEQKHSELLIVCRLLFSPIAWLLCPSPTPRSKGSWQV